MSKTILINSPQPWSHIKITKHHYALSLAKLGYKVYFLNPVSNGTSAKITFDAINENLSVVSFNSLIPYILKFKAKSVFLYILKLRFKQIISIINRPIDVFIDFDCNQLFTDYSFTKANKVVFFPVDYTSKNIQKVKVDYLFSISQSTLNRNSSFDCPKINLGHSISVDFEELAKEEAKIKKNKVINAGYSGNLLGDAVDKALIMQTINLLPNVKFNFYGNYDYTKEKYIQSDKVRFIDYLNQKSNVSLLGNLETKQLIEQLRENDLFFFCYKEIGGYKLDNTHKLLEFLSTGAVCLGNHLSEYNGIDVYEKYKDSDDFLSKFKYIVQNISSFNSLSMQTSRKLFALNHTYASNAARVMESIRD